MNIRHEEQIQMILKDFDFKTIHDTMLFLNRKWNYPNKPAATPTLEELKQIAFGCLQNVTLSTDETAIFSTGGFEAEKMEGMLQLTFVLERVNPLKALLNPEQNEVAG